MTHLRELFQQGQAGLTVYSPDCAQSRLWGNLDHAIHDASGFQPIFRHWINHDINTISTFYTPRNHPPPPYQDPQEALIRYENIAVEKLQYGHLVVRLFLSGPSLLTIWQGHDVIDTLTSIKGATHPAEAKPESIRGRFWCDNAVGNLIHTSDDPDEALRELEAVNLTPILDKSYPQQPLIKPIQPPIDHIAHSGISTLCAVVNRVAWVDDHQPKINIRLPQSGDARATHDYLSGILQEIAKNTTHTDYAELIPAYLAGDLITVTRLMHTLPLTRWEFFVIQCGAITRDKWNNITA